MFLVNALRVLMGSSKLTPPELSARRLHSRVDMWRHRGGMSCACPGGLEMSRGSVEAKHVMSQQHWSSCGPSELMSAHVSPLDYTQLVSHHFTPHRQSSRTHVSSDNKSEGNWMIQVIAGFHSKMHCDDQLFHFDHDQHLALHI